jgi:hypothetical protein|tara:strand:+ start:2081 stop:2533 length:453 start_codon:yes stop_codon:yes gene_type:complete
MWNQIQKEIDESVNIIHRSSSRVKSTGEVFTPSELVISLLKSLPIDRFAPKFTFLDPACGDGQFLMGVKLFKMYFHNMSEKKSLEDIYGVDIMRDNVDLCKKRLGGGNIIMGNTLNYSEKIDGQTPQEHLQMIEIFGPSPNLTRFMNDNN